VGLPARGQEEQDTQDVEEAQKQKPSKAEMEEKIDQFMHGALHDRESWRESTCGVLRRRFSAVKKP
jgi:hypothetical protein